MTAEIASIASEKADIIAAPKAVSGSASNIAATTAMHIMTPIAGFSLTKSTTLLAASLRSSSNLSLSTLNSIDKVSERENVSCSGTLNEFSSSIFKLVPLVDVLIDSSISFAFARIVDNSMLSLFKDALRLSRGVCISAPSNSPPLNFITFESSPKAAFTAAPIAILTNALLNISISASGVENSTPNSLQNCYH